MTVSYQYDVASSASGGFIRLLFRWRGSVWKVVYRDMLIFLVCYVLLTLLYQFVLTENQQKIFEKVVYFCSTFMDLIPLSFMLGFYVSFIAARWWSQFIAIPWPDKLMNIVAMYVPGLDEASRVVRRTLMRYLNLSLVLVLRSISMAVKRRFPTKEHLIEAGFMTKTELEMFQSVPSTEFNTFWIPCTWFINVLREARQECRITDSNGLKLIMEELNEFRSKCGLLWGYDWISIPLVYTQVVTMATYAFFVACMFGRQNVSSSGDPALRNHRYDYYIPIFTILQLMFYMGLLKVAEQLINPFGDDDEDFELNWIIDRHMKVSYLGVDTLNGTPPPLVKDTYYNELDVKIPYTEASRSYKKKTYRGSVAYMQVPMEQQGMVLPDNAESDDDGETVSESMGPRRPSQYTLFQNKMGSFTNLDNISLDSEGKGSARKLSAANDASTAKNSSGTLGCTPSTPVSVDMLKAEDDEIILQEVVIDPGKPRDVRLSRSDSLQIPGATTGIKEKKSSSLLSVLRDLSPKIAPKFPREKLKSMFRKKKIASPNPFFKMKGVRFSKDTKDSDSEDSSMAESGSLLSVRDVEITLSNPELTEIEKKMGIHPYQKKTAFPQELTRGLTTLSAEKRSKRKDTKKDRSYDVLSRSTLEPIAFPMTRSTSLPNIQDEPLATTLIIPTFGEAVKDSSSKKDKPRKPKKRKRKSPPPPSFPLSDDSELPPSDKDDISDSSESLSSRRNTLPQITFTRYDQIKTPEHLDLATPMVFGSSASSSRRSSDSTDAPMAPKRTHPLKSVLKDSKHVSQPPDTGQPVGSSKVQRRTSPSPPLPSSKTHSTPPQIPPKHAPQSKPPRPARTWSLTSSHAPTIRTPSPTKSKSFDQSHPVTSKPSISLSLKSETKSPSSLPASTSAPSTPTTEVSPPFPKTSSTPKPTMKTSPSCSTASADEKKEKLDSKPPVRPVSRGRTDSRPSIASIAGIQLLQVRGRDDNSHPLKRQDPSLVQTTRRGSKGDK